MSHILTCRALRAALFAFADQEHVFDGKRTIGEFRRQLFEVDDQEASFSITDGLAQLLGLVEPEPETTWVGMAGLHGYMPNVCDDYDSYQDAVESMAQLHDLGRDRKRKLKRDGYLELNLGRDGNEYISIELASA